MKRYIGLVIGWVLLMVATPVYALEQEIIYQDGQFVFGTVDPSEENLVWIPGDTIVQRYVVKNLSQEKVQMYLTVSATVELPAEMQEWVEISISSKANGWKHVLKPTDTDTGYINERMELGSFAPNQTNDLTMEITLSKEADNRCKDLVTTLEYELTAEVSEENSAGAGPPETGDDSATPYWGLLGAGILLLVWSIISVIFREKIKL